MKKIITFILACLLIVALSVNAYADGATRIGITSFYYSDLPGLEGGSRGRYANVTYSVLEQYLTDVRTAYPNYTYSMRVIGLGTCIGVYSSSNGLLGYLSTSSGFVYCNGDFDSGGSVISDGTSSHKITPIAGTGYYWIDTTYLGTLDRHYVDADTFSRIKLACSAAYRSNAIAIVQEGFQLDGTPSYVLKYLKNGEWVGVVCDEWGPVYCTTINGVGFHGDDGAGDSGDGAVFDDTEVVNAINSVYRAISSVDDTLSYISTYTSRLNNNFVNFANELLTSLHMQSNDLSNIYSVLLAMYQSFYDRFSDLDLTYYNDSEITIYNGGTVDWSESDRGAIDIEANDIGTLELSGFPAVDGYRVSHSIGGDIVVERNDGTYFPNEWVLSGGTVTMPTIESAYSSITVTAPVGTTITVAGNTHTFDDDAPYVVNVELGTYTVSGSYVDNGTTLTADQEVVVDGYNDYAVEFTHVPGDMSVEISTHPYWGAYGLFFSYDGVGHYGSEIPNGEVYSDTVAAGSVISFRPVKTQYTVVIYVDGVNCGYAYLYKTFDYIVNSNVSITVTFPYDSSYIAVYIESGDTPVSSLDPSTVTVTVNPITYTPVTISRLVRPSGSSVWLAYDTEGNVHEFTPASNLVLNRSFVTHTYTAAEVAELDNFPTGYWLVSWTGESHYITVKFEEYSKFFLWLNRFLINFRDTLFMKMQDISVTAAGDVILHGSDHDYSAQLDRIIELLDGQGSYACDHDYVADETQAATCVLPGLVVYNCSRCGDSYSEIVDPYGHDWLCTDHVPDELDDEGNVISAGYDIYTCSRCQEVYKDFDGSGAPDTAGGSIFSLITKVFSRLGSLVGGILSGILNYLDNLLTRIDDLISDFNARTQQVLSFGGDYPLWLAGVWGILPEELQIALGFCVVALILGILGKKLVFS